MEAQPEDRGTTVMERVRAVHLRMVDAVLSGDKIGQDCQCNDSQCKTAVHGIASGN